MKNITFPDNSGDMNYLLSHAVKCISDCVSITDMEEKIIYVNDAFLSAYEYSMEELIGKPVDILRAPGNNQQVIAEVFPQTINGGWEGELQNISKSGREFRIKLTTSVIRNHEGLPFAIMGIARDITEILRMESMAAEKEALYQAVFEHSPVGIGIASEYGEIIAGNNAMERITGYTLDELKSKNLTEIYYDEDDRHKFIQLMNEQGHVYEYPVMLRNRDKQIVEVLLYVTKIQVNGRELYHTLCQDLTAQKKAEARLRETAESFSGLFNSVGDAIYILNEDGVFIDINEGAVKMYGYPREVLIGKGPAFVSADGMNDMDDIGRKVQKAFGGEFQQFEFWGKRANGEAFLKDVRITNGYYFGKPVAIAMALDITYRKKIEEDLQESENRLKSIFRAAPAGIGLMAGNRTIVDVNPYCCELLGYTREEMVGRNAAFLYPDLQEYERVGVEKYKMIATSGTGIIETKWKHKEGKVFDILLSSTLLNAKDVNQGVTFTALNISQLKNVQTELRNKASELEKFNNLMVGRELRMIELKKEINDLCLDAGKEPKYFIPDNSHGGIDSNYTL